MPYDFIYNLRFEFQYIAHLKFFSDLFWVMQNFLRMECYRKLCNNLYWRKLTPGTASYKTRLWMILLTSLSAIFLAFFFDPTDPTLSRSASNLYNRLGRCFKRLEYSFDNFISNLFSISTRQKAAALNILDSENIFLWRSQETYLRTSALRI